MEGPAGHLDSVESRAGIHRTWYPTELAFSGVPPGCQRLSAAP